MGDKVYLKKKEVRRIIRKATRCKRKIWNRIYLPDAEYYLPPMADVDRVLAESAVNRKRWVEERFDCDDFAKVLAADFARDAYKDGTRRSAYCMGVVWGQLPGPHAINWVITDDKRLHFIEPQNDQVFKPRKTDKGIWLIMA